MSSHDNTEFKVNPNHNYYACPAARPGSQLFLVRLEWEADSSEESDDDSDKDDDFTLALINFSGINYILIGLNRHCHTKVLNIADTLNLSIVQGYPLSKSYDNCNVQHFPIKCAADSIFTVEGHVDINDSVELMNILHNESNKVQNYLETRYLEENENEDKITGNVNEFIELLD